MYLILDTETTGIPDFTKPADAEGQPRVASVAMIFCDRDLSVQAEWYTLIKPDGWEMPPEAGSINGLTTERLTAEGIPMLIPLLVYAAAIDDGKIVVAHNQRFDTKMMRGELRRVSMDDRYAKTWTLCTMTLARPLCSRAKLSIVHQELCGEYLDGAHNALNDARACLAILRKLRERGIVKPVDGYLDRFSQQKVSTVHYVDNRDPATAFPPPYDVRPADGFVTVDAPNKPE